MRSLLLKVGSAGEIEGSAILAMQESDELICRKALGRILEKENPAVGAAGHENETISPEEDNRK